MWKLRRFSKKMDKFGLKIAEVMGGIPIAYGIISGNTHLVLHGIGSEFGLIYWDYKLGKERNVFEKFLSFPFYSIVGLLNGMYIGGHVELSSLLYFLNSITLSYFPFDALDFFYNFKKNERKEEKKIILNITYPQQERYKKVQEKGEENDDEDKIVCVQSLTIPIRKNRNNLKNRKNDTIEKLIN